MTTLKTTLIVALSLSFAAGCMRVTDKSSMEMAKPEASRVWYPTLAQDADRDGQVFEYASVLSYPELTQAVVVDGQVHEYH
jgi:hypothetical protein